MPDNTCVCCGRLIPEGSHICLACGDYDDMQTFQSSRRAEIVTNCDKLRAAMSPAAMAALLAEATRSGIGGGAKDTYEQWLSWLESHTN